MLGALSAIIAIERESQKLTRLRLAACDIRFGSKADMATGQRDVCFTPESGHS
jgi:hypothetical protein